MTIIMTLNLPVSRADLESVSAEINASGPPEGLIVHVATEAADGSRVTDVWESRDAFEKFLQAQLGPAMQKYMAEHNMSPDQTPQPQIDEAFDVVVGLGSRI